MSVRKVLNAPHRARLPRKQEKVKKNASAQIDTSTIKECLYGHYATCIQIILYFTVIQKIKDCSRILVTIKLLCQSVCRTLSLSFVSWLFQIYKIRQPNIAFLVTPTAVDLTKVDELRWDEEWRRSWRGDEEEMRKDEKVLVC